jgi:hypothetical protein
VHYAKRIYSIRTNGTTKLVTARLSRDFLRDTSSNTFYTRAAAELPPYTEEPRGSFVVQVHSPPQK